MKVFNIAFIIESIGTKIQIEPDLQKIFLPGPDVVEPDGLNIMGKRS